MSLKAFHKFFIAVAILFCGRLFLSEYQNYARTGHRQSLQVAIAAGGTAFALIGYFAWFLRKSRM